MIRKYELWTLLLSRLSSNIYLGFDSSAAQYPICIHPHLLSLTKLPLVTQEKAIASRKRMATWSPLATLIVNTHSYFLPQYTRQPWGGFYNLVSLSSRCTLPFARIQNSFTSCASSSDGLAPTGPGQLLFLPGGRIFSSSDLPALLILWSANVLCVSKLS